MNSPFRILYLEDDAADVELVQDTLKTEGIACDLTRVETEPCFLAALEQGGFHVILADYTLPSFDGLSALRIVREQRRDLPFIFVSGTLDEEVAIEALKIGATDYVLKSRLFRLVPSIQRALREATERAGRKRAEEDARRSEMELRNLIAEMPVMAFAAEPDGSNAFASRRWSEFAGTSEEAGGGWEATVHPDDLDVHLSKWRASLESGEAFQNEVRHRSASGEYRWFLARAVPLRDEDGRIVKWYGTLTDIEDRKRVEALLTGEKRILEMVAKGDSLAQILDGLCRLVEEQASSVLASILLIEGNRLRHGGAPSLPKAYTEAIDGVVTFRRFLRDSRLPGRTGDRGGHRKRPLVGGLPRGGFAPFSARLLVHAGLLFARQSDRDVRHVLSRAAQPQPARSGVHRTAH